MTNKEALRKLHKTIIDNQKKARIIKTYKDEWYTVNSILGND